MKNTKMLLLLEKLAECLRRGREERHLREVGRDVQLHAPDEERPVRDEQAAPRNNRFETMVRMPARAMTSQACPLASRPPA